MAGVLIRMKLRVMRHSLHGRRAWIFGLGVFYALVGGIASALLPLAAGDDLEVGTDIVAALFALWALGWIVGPVLTGGGDETLRPEHFALLPITSRGLARGLLGASFVGVAPTATLVGFLGAVVVGGRAGAVPGLVAVLGVVLELGFVVVLSRVVIAGLGAALSSRRGRDLGVLLASLAALAYLPFRYVFETIGPVLANRQSPVLSTVVRTLPSGWAAVSVRGAARGDVVAAAAPLLGLVVLITVLLLAWAPLLQRRLTVTAVSVGPSKRSQRAGRGHRSRALGPVGAVTLRELRLWWRDARRRSMLLISVLVGVAVPAFSFAGSGGSMASYTAIFLVAFAALQVGNLYGLDGGSLWHVLVTPGAIGADVRGRQLAWLAIIAPLSVAASVIGPLVTGSTSAYPWLAGLVPVLLGSAAGLIVLQSTHLPFAMPQQRNQNPFSGGAAGSGPGCTRGLAGLAYFLLLVPATVPVIVVVLTGTLTEQSWLSWLGAPVGVAVGAGLAWWWGLLAQRRLQSRGPEILAEVRSGA